MSPAYTAFSFFSAPIPPPPSQREGGDHKLVLPGATAPGTPALNCLRRWLSLPYTCPCGGVLSLSPAYTAFSFFSAPIPPPPSPAGKGEIKVIFMQGASPLASPGLNPGGAGCPCRTRAPVEGVLSLSPAYTAFSFFSAPIPPPPSQREGGDHKLVLPGATAPGTPALNRLRRLQPQRNRHSGGRRIPETALTGSAASGRVFPRK